MTNTKPKSISVKQFQKNHDKEQLRQIPPLDANFNYLTTAEIAERLNISENEVTALCRSGYFKGAFKLGTHWRIPERKIVRRTVIVSDKKSSREAD